MVTDGVMISSTKGNPRQRHFQNLLHCVKSHDASASILISNQGSKSTSNELLRHSCLIMYQQNVH